MYITIVMKNGDTLGGTTNLQQINQLLSSLLNGKIQIGGYSENMQEVASITVTDKPKVRYSESEKE